MSNLRYEGDALLGFDAEEGPPEPVAAATHARWLRSPTARGLMVGVAALCGVALWHRSTSSVQMNRAVDLIGKQAMDVNSFAPSPQGGGQLADAASLPQQQGVPSAGDDGAAAGPGFAAAGPGPGFVPPAANLPAGAALQGDAQVFPGQGAPPGVPPLVPEQGTPPGVAPADPGQAAPPAAAPGVPDQVPPPAEPAAPSVDEKYAKCPASGGDCRKERCCKDPGHQCYEKNEDWAECRPSCEEGMHITDPDSSQWSCEEFGDRTPGEAEQCSKGGEDCSKTECCEAPGTQCYAKSQYWAACLPSCTPGPNLLADDKEPWSCTTIGERSPGAGAWVKDECAHQGEDCQAAGCCADEGFQCFEKSEGWGQCRQECYPGFKENEWEDAWSCKAVGPMTPASGEPGEPVKGQVAAWVAQECKSEGENCAESMCCKSVGWQCFKKNEFWGQCLPDACPPPARRLEELPPAAPAAPPADAAAPAAPAAPVAPAAPADPVPATPDPNAWDCAALGPRSWGLAIKGYPSLYCISLYMPSSYEGAIINKQLDMGAGIFSCDGYDVVASDAVTCGESKDGILVKTQVIESIGVGVSQDGTAGNAKLFMAFWDKIIAGKRFRDYDWTIKADPDAVVLPWRLRSKMAPHIGENVYVVNCNKFPSSPNFPMMFGSVEILSSAAMIMYADGSWKCGQELPWKSWGEDYYLTHCLDFLGVGRISDFTVVGDNVCTGADCGDGDKGSYHPFKTPEDWEACWIQAVPPA